MDRRTEYDLHIALWIERLAWHLAAGAALAVMILVLLGSLRWLDQVAPLPTPGVGAGIGTGVRRDVAAPAHARAEPAPRPPPVEASPPSG